MAVEAVQQGGLYEQIGQARMAWKAEQKVAQESAEQDKPHKEEAPVRNMARNMLKIAASVVVIFCAAAIFKYSTTSATRLYDKNYTSYTLSTSRGAGHAEAIAQAYNNKQWAEVLSLFNSATDKDNQAWFLAGMADMELKKYDEAVGKFEQVLAANLQSGNDYFQDEAEYYLAMSCLARNDVNEAIPLLDKIRSNKQHLFHDKVNQISDLDLRIAQYKNSK
jgi:tetratricopeptide (TPR) repeat protein